GAVVCTIEEGGAPTGDAKPAAAEEKASAPAATANVADENPDSYAAGTASPAAAKILREKGIDPATIKGTGKEGRITKEDAEKAQVAPKAVAPAKEAPKAAAPVAVAGSRNERREKMTSLRKTIAKRLVSVK